MTRVASQILGSFLLLKFKRRALFVTSAVITGLGMALFALATSDLLLQSNAMQNDHHKNTLNQTLNETTFKGNNYRVTHKYPELTSFLSTITQIEHSSVNL